MSRRVAVQALFDDARENLTEAMFASPPAHALPLACPFTLDALVSGRPADLDALLATLSARAAV